MGGESEKVVNSKKEHERNNEEEMTDREYRRWLADDLAISVILDELNNDKHYKRLQENLHNRQLNIIRSSQGYIIELDKRSYIEIKMQKLNQNNQRKNKPLNMENEGYNKWVMKMQLALEGKIKMQQQEKELRLKRVETPAIENHNDKMMNKLNVMKSTMNAEITQKEREEKQNNLGKTTWSQKVQENTESENKVSKKDIQENKNDKNENEIAKPKHDNVFGKTTKGKNTIESYEDDDVSDEIKTKDLLEENKSQRKIIKSGKNLVKFENVILSVEEAENMMLELIDFAERKKNKKKEWNS